MSNWTSSERVIKVNLKVDFDKNAFGHERYIGEQEKEENLGGYPRRESGRTTNDLSFGGNGFIVTEG